MKRVAEVIVVEGKYDKNTLSQIVEASIVTLDGFAAFHDREKLAFLRRLAEKRGLIILTDSDGAGFLLRNFLKGALPSGRVRHAYIPDIPGKERRKRVPGKEGKLGVEGMRPEILLEALRRAGATFSDENPDGVSVTAADSTQNARAATGSDSAAKDSVATADSTRKAPAGMENLPGNDPITMADFMEWGLSGGTDSAARRRELLKKLDLPEKLSAKALLEALNLLYTRQQVRGILEASGVWEPEAPLSENATP